MENIGVEPRGSRVARRLGESSILAVVICCWIFLASRASGQVVAWTNGSPGPTNVPPAATNVVALAGGVFHGMALRADGTMVAWGNDVGGQCDIPAGLTNVVGIGGGEFHSIALESDGRAAVWGMAGQYGYGDLEAPVDATNLVAVATGPSTDLALAIRADGTVRTWGSTLPLNTNIPPNARDIVSVAAGNGFSLALRADGRIVAWGDPFGNEIAIPASATNIVAIAAGDSGGIGLRVDGTIVGWGMVSLIGLPTNILSSDGYTNVVDVACPLGYYTTTASCLALRGDGKLLQNGKTSPVAGSNYTAIGASDTAGFALVGAGPPVFTGLPVNRTVPAGSTAYFRQMATGAMPIKYQWVCNGTNVPNGTNSYLGVTNVQPSQAGSYYALIASNSVGVTTNLPMTLSVVPLEVYAPTGTLTLLLGATNIFTNSVGGKGPFSYQWQMNGSAISGATNTTLSFVGLQFSNAGAYALVVSNAFGVATGAVEVLNVVPSILGSPLQDQTIFPRGSVTFNPHVQTLIPVAYQWQFNGINLDGATNAFLSLTNVQFSQAGTYSLIYNDAYETVTNSANLYMTCVAVWGEAAGSPPPNSTNLIAVATGASQSVGINADHTVVGWGITAPNEYLPPVGLSNVIAVTAGFSSSFALKADGTVAAWGEDLEGVLEVPAGLSNVVAICAGSTYHVMALKSDGTVVVWGENGNGETNVPAGLGNVVAISAGEFNCLALKADGTVVAWGAGTNDTGSDPNWGQSQVPATLTNAIQIAAGGEFCGLALKAGGAITGWGDNIYGELTVPAGLSNVIAIAAGDGHTVALKGDGTVAAWGYNGYGETNMPAGISNVIQIAASDFHTMALIGDAPAPTQATISNVTFTASGLSVSLPSRCGRVYALEYADTPTSGSWTRLPLVAGVGGLLTLTDPTTNAPQRFYRVRQW